MQERNPVTLIYHLNNAVSRCFSIYSSDECAELSYTNARIIRFVAAETMRDVYQKDVEKEFGITRSTASRVLMMMEQKGLITRHCVKHDARLKKIMLTEKARRLDEVMSEKSNLLNDVMLRGFTDEEAARLESYIQRMTRSVEEENNNLK